MSNPRFSIIMPVHNAAATLALTVQSVLNQTAGDFELIMIDDGSTDNSLIQMLELASGDQRIKLLSHANRGVAATRNIGIDTARGDLIAFIDADDIWVPTKLARHRALHDADSDTAISFARIAFIDADAVTVADAQTVSTVPSGCLSVAQVIGENPACTMSNIVATRACINDIGGFRDDMTHAEDQEWLARAASRHHPIEGINETLVGYRMSADGLSANLGKMLIGWRRLAMEYGVETDLPAAEAVYCRYLARRALRSGASATHALEYTLRGLRCDYHSFLADTRRGWATVIASLAAPLIPRPARMRLFS